MNPYTAGLLFGFIAGLLGIIPYIFDDSYMTFQIYASIMLVVIISMGLIMDGR
jgi:hypothetical protein